MDCRTFTLSLVRSATPVDQIAILVTVGTLGHGDVIIIYSAEDDLLGLVSPYVPNPGGVYPVSYPYDLVTGDETDQVTVKMTVQSRGVVDTRPPTDDEVQRVQAGFVA